MKHLQTEQNCQKHKKPLAISEDNQYGQSHGHQVLALGVYRDMLSTVDMLITCKGIG